MEYRYEYSTYNSHHKVLVNLQASIMDALKCKACATLDGLLAIFVCNISYIVKA